ncbi:TIGR02680 family protein [Pseudonocardia sp. RS11V-5]|uniref:TIGR02680 family protein n=1 Tax=Pseudonocardia terrae TaxID=2905831 RepID=UPI001E35F05C|nr:TIGR02680 family protein [Pseudonocardia terrae]MCE3550176.1 TIGR02680 family protein [Pseudonocardia terrae]
MSSGGRFRLTRAGVLNVWQYDDQVFEFEGGRLLLRGANGAGKSKTLEMLLPFVLDGDKARMTASARHHTSLLWLMLDGYGGQNRAGYLWVEFTRGDEALTCGIGIRASQSARSATSWHFTFPGRVGVDLHLEDEAGPLAQDRLREVVEAGGGTFVKEPRAYKQHIGRLLFGLEPTQYEELLRLLYWLRQPQVGEDIEPARLAEQLIQALPQLDDEAVRTAGDTFDELAAFGEQLERQRRSAEGVAALATVYAAYAREVLRRRGADLAEAHTERTRRGRTAEAAEARVRELAERRRTTEREQEEVGAERRALAARLGELRADPLMRTAQRLDAARQLARIQAEESARAERTVRTARERAEASGGRLTQDADRLGADLREFSDLAHRLATGLAEVGAGPTLAVAALPSTPTTTGEAEAAVVALERHRDGAATAHSSLGALQAAVVVVGEALRTFDRAADERRRAEETAAAAEQRAEEERGQLADARTAAAAAESRYTAALATWTAEPAAVPFRVPELLTVEAVAGIGGLARAAAEEPLRGHRERRAAAAAARAAAEERLAGAVVRREAAVAETDPAPPEPAWGRAPRNAADGAPFWSLVDFVDELGEDGRAGLEGALEASGLLDAWIRVDGAVLDDRADTVLATTTAQATGMGLGSLLRADPPPGCPVSAGTVRAVLARIAVHGADEPAGQALVGTDGTWRLGVLDGRARKQAAQYVGATARAAERARRIAELDASIARFTEARDAAAREERAAQSAVERIEAWLGAVPAATEVVAAWAEAEQCARGVARAERFADGAEAGARAARSVEAGARRELHDRAAGHDLPTEAGPLEARRFALQGLDSELTGHVRRCGDLAVAASRWAQDAERHQLALRDAEDAAEAGREARARADRARAAADELEETVGRPLLEIRARIDEAEDRDRALAGAQARLDATLRELLEEGGAAAQDVRIARDRVAEHEPVLVQAVRALASLPEATGLLESGDPEGHASAESRSALVAGLAAASGFVSGEPVPAPTLALGRRLAALLPAGRSGTDNAVLVAWQEAASGPAADVDPRVVEVAGVLTVVGRDDSGERPVGELATRLSAAVARDAELLTDRERRLFEEHILGDLGESLRARRVEAEELVAEMNNQLGGVSTRQGIQVRLRWALRDDVVPDARRAVELLGRPVGLLLPDERQELRDALHRLIEASRAEAPEDSYSEHLARALDYRRWFAFRVRYTRPETEGTWYDLHRRSPLSQGEQKVVCYLPLFAAAAAHFSSLAGAAPHSPRFVLLDDAFPKIDVRTHPLLFGLLVQLDLDFVVTSERLWGDHATVPSLAIYEALRDPTERGIAQYRHTWDGTRLRAVG